MWKYFYVLIQPCPSPILCPVWEFQTNEDTQLMSIAMTPWKWMLHEEKVIKVSINFKCYYQYLNLTILILSLIGILWLLLPLKVSGIFFYCIELMVFLSTLFIYHKKNNISYIILPSDIIKFIEFCFFFVFVVDEKWLLSEKVRKMLVC